MIAGRPYEDVLIDDIAQQAGLSRALLYRHFPSKRAFFAAVYQTAADRLFFEAKLDPADPLVGQLVQGMNIHLDYFVANRHAVLAANRVGLRPGPRRRLAHRADLLPHRARRYLRRRRRRCPAPSAPRAPRAELALARGGPRRGVTWFSDPVGVSVMPRGARRRML
ncbi:TetR/AcrR family transcriptional regulator [Streptomyces mirabilis]|uniref:TetR/AcrR family transcriptional regulator n=1 Tax=Streptomyces mirabilis TaxID=68239 RepID=UPI0036D7AF37